MVCPVTTFPATTGYNVSISVICKGILIHYLCLLEVYKAKLGTHMYGT